MIYIYFLAGVIAGLLADTWVEVVIYSLVATGVILIIKEIIMEGTGQF